jgi:hypothetical protein
MKTSVLCVALLVLPLGSVWAQANRTTTILDTEFNIVDVNPCNGEAIQYSGTIQEVLHEVFNANGSHASYTLTLQGVSAVGLATGTLYRSGGASTTSSNTHDFSGPLTMTSNNRFVAQGSGVVFYSSFTFHTTVNANGELTAVVEKGIAECR